MDKQIIKETNAQFAKNLQLYRTLANLSQSEMAKLCEISQPRYNLYEAGKNMPTPVYLIKMAQVLGVTVEALFANTAVHNIPVANADYCIAVLASLQIDAIMLENHHILITHNGIKKELAISEVFNILRNNKKVLGDMLKKTVLCDIFYKDDF